MSGPEWEALADRVDAVSSAADLVCHPAVSSAVRTLSTVVDRARKLPPVRARGRERQIHRMGLEERREAAATWEGQAVRVEICGRRREADRADVVIGRVLAVATSYSNTEAADELVLRTPEDATLAVSLAQVRYIDPFYG